MKVKFLKLHPDAEIPKKKYYKDFCYDVKAVREEEIAPNVWKYYLGFALQAENHVYNPRVRIDFVTSALVLPFGSMAWCSPTANARLTKDSPARFQ